MSTTTRHIQEKLIQSLYKKLLNEFFPSDVSTIILELAIDSEDEAYKRYNNRLTDKLLAAHLLKEYKLLLAKLQEVWSFTSSQNQLDKWWGERYFVPFIQNYQTALEDIANLKTQIMVENRFLHGGYQRYYKFEYVMETFQKGFQSSASYCLNPPGDHIAMKVIWFNRDKKFGLTEILKYSSGMLSESEFIQMNVLVGESLTITKNFVGYLISEHDKKNLFDIITKDHHKAINLKGLTPLQQAQVFKEHLNTWLCAQLKIAETEQDDKKEIVIAIAPAAYSYRIYVTKEAAKVLNSLLSLADPKNMRECYHVAESTLGYFYKHSKPQQKSFTLASDKQQPLSRLPSVPARYEAHSSALTQACQRFLISQEQPPVVFSKAGSYGYYFKASACVGNALARAKDSFNSWQESAAEILDILRKYNQAADHIKTESWLQRAAYTMQHSNSTKKQQLFSSLLGKFEKKLKDVIDYSSTRQFLTELQTKITTLQKQQATYITGDTANYLKRTLEKIAALQEDLAIIQHNLSEGIVQMSL